MRRILALVGAAATLAAGVTAAVALGAGTSSPDTSTGTTTAATSTTADDTSTSTTTAVAAGATSTTADDTSTSTTTAVAAGATTSTTSSASSKVWVCHHTGSWKHPYHLIHISTHALRAHTRHGDVTPGGDNSCPTTQPTGAKIHGRGNGQSNNAKTKDDNPGKGKTNDD